MKKRSKKKRKKRYRRKQKQRMTKRQRGTDGWGERKKTLRKKMKKEKA